MTYLITFACYGCHLHGNEAGSADRDHNLPGARLVDADPRRVSFERERMDRPLYGMDKIRRDVVLTSAMERCSNNRWMLLAAHIRTNHVHVVVEAEVRPERVMNDLKSYASRCLNRLGLDEPPRNVGRDTEVRDGCGSERVYARRFDMSWTVRGNGWKFSSGRRVKTLPLVAALLGCVVV